MQAVCMKIRLDKIRKTAPRPIFTEQLQSKEAVVKRDVALMTCLCWRAGQNHTTTKARGLEGTSRDRAHPPC